MHIIKNEKSSFLQNFRVNSLSPVSKGKDSFGLYYDQNQPDSAESKNKSKVVTYYSK